MKRLIVIVGPTASGKSVFTIKLARKIKGEIISADSRQVYCGMDIGTGKVTKREQKLVPHHLLDVASPRNNFSAGQFVKLARRAIADIIRRGKIPIIVGGTGFYIDSLVYNIPLPEVKPDWKLRKQLEQKTPAQLLTILKKLDPVWAQNVDPKNPRRLVRAIEVSKVTKSQKFNITDFYKQKVDAQFIGLAPKQKKLERNIAKRLMQRLKQGMVREVSKLHAGGLSWKRLESFGLEYKWLALFLQKKITRAEMLTNLKRDIIRYAKRQMRWFKRNPNIRWRTN
ncbi:MAG: tRNA (adenosine(37)-N6)-dimethylallyltransferase MiaA [Candidatus Yanofskybacteria bacterium RIFCSPLOWO2_02_FULL_47_9b]|uniref:tRNA dimethylallyltransferase n=1 Tax=Candidatus Yanofskybacteria bacterium RIFCSPLOWO2_02_FULL_47_9b TaxID=1802708 RepID=A0A1F8H7R4_9BACT|nr:MAG: tRNA (adenosine(37)-N6)-dimethylallyltransferase MiaA [Candidatus Yanofskybacteria bacterium RIFCSPLOWO2_02_FULL_47_9b]